MAVLQKFELPAYGVDLSQSDLYRPILPPDTDPIALPYPRYDVICTYMEYRSRVPTAPDVPALLKSEIDTLSSEALTALNNYYAATHPECMSTVSAEVRDAIVGSYLHGTPLTYEN